MLSSLSAEPTLSRAAHWSTGEPAPAAGSAILLVGSDSDSRSALKRFFAGHGFNVLEACDRAAMNSVLQCSPVDVIVVDDPSVQNGLGLCRELAVGRNAPIVMIADCEDHTDRIIALEVGADEVLSRPHHPRELLARVRALLRRSGHAGPGAHEASIDFAGWRLNERTRDLRSPSGKHVPLAAAEYDLLKVFLSSPGTIVDAATVSAGRGVDLESCQANFRTSVCRLRRKLGKDRSGVNLLRTVYGQGYVLEVNAVSAPAEPA